MELESRLDRAWAEVAGSHWRERYQHVQQTSERLADLDSAAKEGPLEIDEAWERASLRAELEGDDASLPLLQEILEREPEHASARFAIGRIKLASDDEGGLEDVRVVMDVFHDAVIPGCQLVYDYLCRNGRVREAEPYRERAIAQRERLERAEAERSQLRLDGRYQTHGLEPELLFELSRRLESETRVARAWVVRRDVEEFPERPMFVLGIERVASAFEFLRPRLRRRRDLELQQALAHDLAWEPDHFVVVLNHRPSKVLGIFTAVADSQILPRSQSR